MHLEEALESLRSSYASPHHKAGQLNADFRSALIANAKQNNIDLHLDDFGNIYINRPGNNPSIASLALAFPLDSSDEHAFETSFRVFHRMNGRDLDCGITLMGYTSITGQYNGFEVWQNSTPGSWPLKSNQPDALQHFSQYPSPSEYTMSAIFLTAQSNEDSLVLEGSNVLVKTAQTHIPGGYEATVKQAHTKRAPFLSVTGSIAEDVVEGTICDYNKYVAAIWDSF